MTPALGDALLHWLIAILAAISGYLTGRARGWIQSTQTINYAKAQLKEMGELFEKGTAERDHAIGQLRAANIGLSQLLKGRREQEDCDPCFTDNCGHFRMHHSMRFSDDGKLARCEVDGCNCMKFLSIDELAGDVPAEARQ